jgi:hypothetical protein
LRRLGGRYAVDCANAAASRAGAGARAAT